MVCFHSYFKFYCPNSCFIYTRASADYMNRCSTIVVAVCGCEWTYYTQYKTIFIISVLYDFYGVFILFFLCKMFSCHPFCTSSATCIHSDWILFIIYTHQDQRLARHTQRARTAAAWRQCGMARWGAVWCGAARTGTKSKQASKLKRIPTLRVHHIFLVLIFFLSMLCRYFCIVLRCWLHTHSIFYTKLYNYEHCGQPASQLAGQALFEAM